MHQIAAIKKRVALPKTSKEWISYFQHNKNNLLKIPWNDPHLLTHAERFCISKSVSIFQLGESSEGKRLKKLTARYASQIGRASFEEAMRLFIQEEQRHAADLARFLSQQGIPLRRIHWSDVLFRFLRRFWNFETCLCVLLTAELVAKIYYGSLRRATQSPVLRQICTQLLKDEVQHLNFHSQNVASLQQHRRRTSAKLWEKSYTAFYGATLCAVWIGHRKVFHASGLSFREFWKQSQNNLQLTLRNIRKLRQRNQTKNLVRFYQRSLHFHTVEGMQFIDITDRVTAAVRSSRIQCGVANIQTEHTTTGLIVNENEPLLLQDIKRLLNRIAPQEETYLHNDFSIRTVNMQPFEDKNGHAHCRALFLRTAESINVINGRLALGKWQRIFLIECDHARPRTVNVMIFGK